MPRGSKEKYSNKQKRQAKHIEEGYEKRGTGKKTAQRIAWATVNKETGGGEKGGSARGRKAGAKLTETRANKKAPGTSKRKTALRRASTTKKPATNLQ